MPVGSGSRSAPPTEGGLRSTCVCLLELSLAFAGWLCGGASLAGVWPCPLVFGSSCARQADASATTATTKTAFLNIAVILPLLIRRRAACGAAGAGKKRPPFRAARRKPSGGGRLLDET